MTGYMMLKPETVLGDSYQFHIGEDNLAQNLYEANRKMRVMVLQLDCDELEAALWGLEQWHKPGPQVPMHNRRGVWVAYHSDWSGAQVFLEEIDALRWALDNACTSVKFWEFGQDKPN